jgi:alkaline phosphatase D
MAAPLAPPSFFDVVLWISALLVLVTLAACHPSDGDGGKGQPFTRIAFGSCAFQWEAQPVFRAIADVKPDAYLSLGDAIYGDYDGENAYEVTPETLRREWGVLEENPDWRYLVDHVPLVMGTWDNHDYGHHSAGAEFSLKEESKEIFLDFFGEPTESERRSRPGIYDAGILGSGDRRVQIILLDTRSFKSPPALAERPAGMGGSLGKYAPDDDSAATLLGESQWAWLAEQLKQPAEVRLICSSGQVVADEKGMDEWGNYPLERRRLFDLIGETGAEGVMILSGNVHFAEVSAYEGGPYPFIDFTASGLTHTNPEYAAAANGYRVAGPFSDINFGLVEILWEPEGPAILLSARDVEGREVFEYRIGSEDLGP